MKCLQLLPVLGLVLVPQPAPPRLLPDADIARILVDRIDVRREGVSRRSGVEVSAAGRDRAGAATRSRFLVHGGRALL